MKPLEIHWDFSPVTNMSWTLWASNEKMALLTEKMSDRFSPATQIGSQLFQLAVLLIIIAIVVGTVYFLSKTLNLSKKNVLNSDFRSIYQKLCTVHRLNFRERLLIRRVIKTFGIIDPLLIFVEPQYFHSALTRSDFKANRTMLHHLINKLFGFIPNKESSSRHEQFEALGTIDELPVMDFSKTDFPEAIFQVGVASETPLETQTPVTEAPIDDIPVQDEKREAEEQIPLEIFSETGTFDRKKPFYPRIPGSQAFSSLASTIDEVRTEIASKSLQHNLLSGRENNRTFKVHDFAEPMVRELHVPVKKTVSAKNHVENQRTIRIEDAHQESWNPKNSYGEVFTVEDVALLEAMITEKQRKKTLPNK